MPQLTVVISALQYTNAAYRVRGVLQGELVQHVL